MTVSEYTDYATRLGHMLTNRRSDPDTDTRVEITVCRNGHRYKIVEHMGTESYRQCWTGPLVGDRWTVERGDSVEDEVQRFFSLPTIVAYNDLALRLERNPITKTHWDATIALVEVEFESGVTRWKQRMLFAGFTDAVHAEFAIAVDADIMVHDYETGDQLFEWTTSPPDPSTTSTEN